MRKLVILLTLVALLAVGLGSSMVTAQDDMVIDCGTDEEVTVSITSGAVGSEEEQLDRALAIFNEACPNITVEKVFGPDSTTDRLALYLQIFEQESPEIDVLQIDVIWPGVLAEHLIDLGEYASQEVIDSHFPRIIENNTVDGALLGMPWFTDAGMLYYRTDLLEKYGYDGPPATWDELTEMATTIQEGERGEGNDEFWGFVFQGNSYEGLTCDALEWQFSSGGGTIISPEGEIQVNNDETIGALELAASWIGTISPPGVLAYQEEDARGVWESGNAAFMRNWPYAYSLSIANNEWEPGVDFDATALPSGTEDGGGAATLGGWQLAVSRYSEHPDAAAALTLFLTSASEQKTRAIEASLNPTIASLYEDEDVLAATPIFGSLYDVFINAVARPSTVTGLEYPAVSELYWTAVHNVLSGDLDADEAMADLEADLQEIMDSMMEGM